MAKYEIHQTDIVRFIVTIKNQDEVIVDLSPYTTKQIWFKPRGGATIKKDAAFVTDGEDGKIEYTTAGTDLNVAGEWNLQAFYSDGVVWRHTEVVKFNVYTNL